MLKRWMILGLACVASGLFSGCSSVIARVNGENISRKEFHARLEQAAGLQVLQQMILRDLVLQRAEAEGVMPTADDVLAEVAKMKEEQFEGDEAKMREWMKTTMLDDTELHDQIRLQLAQFRLRTNHLNPTEEDLKAFFSEYKDQYFDKPARVTFRQIVVPSQQQAQQILAQLNTEETLFQKIAQEQSVGETAANGGLVSDVPWTIIEQQAPPVAEALKKLEPNQISQQPIHVTSPNPQTAGAEAWVVVKLLEEHAAEPADYEKIKEDVREAFLMANAKPEDQLMQSLIKGADVTVLDERFKPHIEPAFAAGTPQLTPEMQQQMEANQQLTEPTHLDESTLPPTSTGAPGETAAPAPTAPATTE